MTVSLFVFVGSYLMFSPTRAVAEPPRLVIVVSVDQLAYEYLERFDVNFSASGFFRQVAKEGAWYSDCHHRHAFTITGPGHSVMLTGTYPFATGIIGNDWFDQPNRKVIYCVEDTTQPIVGVPAGSAELKGVSPKNLLVPTVGDVLKKSTGGKAKVFGITLKDRAAVLMAGHAADAAYWFDSNTGYWVTSRYYRPELPDWLKEINTSDISECYAGQAWRLLYPAEKYRLHHPDDATFEGGAEGLSRSFPHELQNETNTKYFKQLAITPFGNQMTMRVAELLVQREQLGQDDVPDMLCLGLSSNDYVGHNFGPHSLEVEDITYRTDVLLGEFLQFLDNHVGPGKWTLALTADHGVGPIPEYAATIGLPGKRNPLGDLKKLQEKLEAALVTQFGKPADEKGFVERVESHQVYLRPTAIAANGNPSGASLIRGAVKEWLTANAPIKIAFTRDELLANAPQDYDLPNQFRRSCNPQRSGDVLFTLKPYQIQGTTPATHGSPWQYDTHVPLLLIGSGVKPGKNNQPVSPAMLAPTIAKLLGIDPPAGNVEKQLDALR